MYDNSSLAINLRNGSQIWIVHYSSGLITFFVDLNGSKKPNTFGKDIFVISYWTKSNYFVFDSLCDSDKKYVKRSVNVLKSGSACRSYNYGCNKSGRGMWCGALIEASGWQFPKDYPW